MKRVKTKTSKMHRISRLLAGCLAGVALLVTASAASAATYFPTRTDDPAPNGCKPKDCSLREAVIASNANPGSTIVLRPGKRYELTRRGLGEDASATGDLDLTAPLTVKTKKGRRGAKRAVIEGNDIDRIFDAGTERLKLVRVVARYGHARNGAGAGDDGDGGAIRGGTVELHNSRLVSNVADGDGGAIFNSAGRIRVSRSTIANNQTGSDGGGIANRGGSVAISNSTISGNEALDSGGGIENERGLTLINSTITNNRADGDGGGIAARGGASTTELNGVTVARNGTRRGGLGGGLYQGAGDVISARNTIVALNLVLRSATGPDCFNASTGFDSLGHNMIGNADGCTGFDASGDLIGGPARLVPPAHNGGPTRTIALKPDSPAINGAGSEAPRYDQRGVKRGKKPDIGAYERVVKGK